jgi:hypothetical protein
MPPVTGCARILPRSRDVSEEPLLFFPTDALELFGPREVQPGDQKPETARRFPADGTFSGVEVCAMRLTRFRTRGKIIAWAKLNDRRVPNAGNF